MNLLDWIILIVWVGFTLSGFWKGAVRIVFGLGGVAIGLWMALALGAGIEAWLVSFIAVGWVAALLARLIPLIVCLAVFLISGWGLDRSLRALRLGWLNRLAGAGLAGFIGAVLLGVFIIAAAENSADFAAVSRNSTLAPLFTEAWRSLVGP